MNVACNHLSYMYLYQTPTRVLQGCYLIIQVHRVKLINEVDEVKEKKATLHKTSRRRLG